MKVSCVTGTINRLPLLKRMIASVRAAVGDLSYEIIIVDSNSNDGTREWLQEQTDVIYINGGKPQGSKQAFQLGCERATGEYVFIGNDDITIIPRSVAKAVAYLDAHPHVGQVAFYHRYQNRQGVNTQQPIVQRFYGYIYAQTGVIRRSLGVAAGWCGPEGFITYAWDTRLSMRLWEMGWEVVALHGCETIDYEFDDETRQRNTTQMRAGKARHPDHELFLQHWPKGRMPKKDAWVPAQVNAVLEKARTGTLRTLRFKGAMSGKAPERRALIDVFAKYGLSRQFNHTRYVAQHGRDALQPKMIEIVQKWKPDLVLLQAQRPNNATIQTARAISKMAYTINFDADPHYPLTQFHFGVAKAVDLQVVISPDLFPAYASQGARNIIWWPIGLEREYINCTRPTSGWEYDVAFLGSLYGLGQFPEAETRRDAVLALDGEKDLSFLIHGYGWNKTRIKTTTTGEQHAHNAELYGTARMALSLSWTAELWGYTSDRLYNISATGCPPLVQYFPGMEEHGYVDEETAIVWHDIPEMLEKAKHYRRHWKAREAIGRATRKMTLARHTWDARVEELFRLLRGLA
jgi:glycosyltransferase involved in cell wall biosynthesis